MHEWVENLLDVQDLDLRMARFREQIDSGPAEKEKLKLLLADVGGERDEAHKTLKDREKRLKTLEIEVESVKTRKRDFQAKSAMIKNNEDYRAAIAQVEACDKRIESLEDEQLTIMQDIESCRTALTRANRELDAAKARISTMEKDLETREANARRGLDDLNRRRDEAAKKVNRDVLTRYDRIRTGRNRRGNAGPILVAVHDTTCEGCHMTVTAQIRTDVKKGACVTCEYCGAMLYWAD